MSVVKEEDVLKLSGGGLWCVCVQVLWHGVAACIYCTSIVFLVMSSHLAACDNG